MKTPTVFPLSTPFGSYVVSWRPSLPFPPQRRGEFHQLVLEEILERRVETRRNRLNQRCVKRKMSNFPLRTRSARPLPPVDIEKAIRILN